MSEHDVTNPDPDTLVANALARLAKRREIEAEDERKQEERRKRERAAAMRR